MQTETARLRLRNWREEDIAPAGEMHADPQVGVWLGAPLSARQNLAFVRRQQARAAENGFVFWAVETLSGAFVGACGLGVVATDMPLRPGVEINWRLSREHWGKGYATEAARAVLDEAWCAGLVEVQAITARTNMRSRAVMDRIGMTYEPDCDFAHPRLSPDHPLLDHVVYSIRRPA